MKRPLLIALVAVLTRIPAFFLPMNRDSGTFAYGGWRILHGEFPYLNFFDNKPPGIFYIDALAIRLFGATPTALVVFQLILGIFTALLFWTVARKLTGEKAAFVAALLFAFFHACYGLNEDGNYTESYLALPVLLAVFLVLRWSSMRRGYVLPLAAGALGALAGAIKQPGASVLPALIIYLIFSNPKDRSNWLGAASAALGSVASVALIAVWMAHRHILSPAIEANFGFNRLYSIDAYTGGWSASFWSLLRGLDIAALPILGAIGGLIYGCRRRLPTEGTIWLLASWFFLDLAGLAMGGRYYTHYFLAILPSALLLTAVFIDAAATTPRTAAAALVAGVVLFVGPVWSVKGSIPERQQFPISSVVEREYRAVRWIVEERMGLRPALPAYEIADWLKAVSVEDDTIYIWGYDPRIAFLSGRAIPSRFIHIHPLAADTPDRPQKIRELARDIETKRPRFIVDQSSLPQMRMAVPPLVGPCPVTSKRSMFLLDGYEPVKQVIARHYQGVEVVGGCVIYELQD